MIQFTIHRSQLLPALTRAGRVVQARNTISVLANAHVAVTKAGIRITATDLELTATATAEPVSVKTEGVFTWPMKTVRDFVARLPESAEIAVTVDDRAAKLSAGRPKLTVAVLPAGDFPLRDDETFDANFALPGRDLARLLAEAGFSASTEEARFYLNGVFLHAAGDRLCGVATDAHRLALHRGPATAGEMAGAEAMPDRAGNFPGVIVPTRAVEELAKIGADAGAAEVAVSVSALAIRAAAAGWEVVSKIIEASYPPYERVIPEKNPNIATVPLADLSAALDRVMLAAGEKGEAVQMEFGDGALRLSGHNTEADTHAEDEVACALEGKPVAIVFNGRLLASILGKLGAKGDARFELNTNASATRILRAGDDTFETVLMPIRKTVK